MWICKRDEIFYKGLSIQPEERIELNRKWEKSEIKTGNNGK